MVPKASLKVGGNQYEIMDGECRGIKEILILLTHLYNDDAKYLIVDEPELHLHPQFQTFFIEEVRKIAGDPDADLRKKCVFLVTHSPFIVDMKGVDDLRSVICFDTRFNEPTHLYDLPDDEIENLSSLIPRLNVHHKQLFFSDRQIFAEGILDAHLIQGIQNSRKTSVASAGICVIDVGGKEEANKYLSLCIAQKKEAFFLYDLDGLFSEALRSCIPEDEVVTDFLLKLGLAELGTLGDTACSWTGS